MNRRTLLKWLGFAPATEFLAARISESCAAAPLVAKAVTEETKAEPKLGNHIEVPDDVFWAPLPRDGKSGIRIEATIAGVCYNWPADELWVGTHVCRDAKTFRGIWHGIEVKSESSVRCDLILRSHPFEAQVGTFKPGHMLVCNFEVTGVQEMIYRDTALKYGEGIWWDSYKEPPWRVLGH